MADTIPTIDSTDLLPGPEPVTVDPAQPEEVQATVQRVLETMPESQIEARRTINRDFGFEPSPEELHAVVRLAHESPAGTAREMSRGALELRVRAEAQIAQVMDKPLHGAGIQLAARSVANLLHEVDGFAQALRAASGALGNIEGGFLRDVGEILMPSREVLVAASVIAPRLSLFTDSGDANDLLVAIPSLTEDGALLIANLLQGEDPRGNGASRVSINALALKTILLDDLAVWDGLCGDDAIESRESVARRLQHDKTAYLVLAQQIQIRQDLALLAGLRDLASDLRAAKKDLFAVYVRLAAVLNGAADPESTRTDGDKAHVGTGDVERLLAECRASDAIAHAQRSVRQTTEELFLDALERETAAKSTDISPRRRVSNILRARRRMRILTSIAGILFLGCLGVYGNRAARSGTHDLSFPAAELNGSLVVSQALAIGSMMYAETSRFVWDDLETSERTSRVAALGLQAQANGFDNLCLTDENRVELALWSSDDGVTVHELEGPPR